MSWGSFALFNVCIQIHIYTYMISRSESYNEIHYKEFQKNYVQAHFK